MDQKQVFVEVVELNIDNNKPMEVVTRLGPMSEGKAERVEMGLLRNMDLEKFSTRQVPA
jgi:hypothetical protein